MATPFDNKKLQLMTKTLPGGGFPPSLKPDMFKGNPSLFVLTGNKKGDGITYIRAGLEHKTAGIICQLVETMADKVIAKYKENGQVGNEAESTYVTVECKAGKERETVAKVIIGSQKDDTLFISVISTKETQAPVIQFVFGADLYHPVAVIGSDALTKCISAVAAKEWAVRTRTYWYTYSIVSPEEESAGNDSWKGNNNNNSYSKPAQSNEEPMPWDS